MKKEGERAPDWKFVGEEQQQQGKKNEAWQEP